MSTQSSPPRAYSFPPLFRGASASQQLRVSEAERQAVVDRLATHYADGRLDHAEFDERVGQAMSAKTRADLSGLFADLPEAGAPPAPGAASQAPGAAPGVLRRRHRHPVLGVVLLVVIIVAAAHAVFAGPWLFLGFLAVALLFATRRIRPYRPSHDH